MRSAADYILVDHHVVLHIFVVLVVLHIVVLVAYTA